MILRLLLLFLTILPFTTSSLQAGMWDNIVDTWKGRSRPTPPSIRILVLHDVEGAQLEVKGKYSLFDPYTDSYISSRFVGKSRQIQALSDGLKWGESFPGLYQIKIRPDEESTLIAVNGKEYEGLVFIYDIGGSLSAVNQIPVEDYVRSVLAQYQSQNLHPEALAAIAIVARTNAYFQTVNPKNTYWAVDAQKVGFQGRVPVSQNIAEAVRATRYMIMSRTGIYEGVATPFAAQLDSIGPGHPNKEMETAKISLEEANQMAENGQHAAQILAKAFPGTTIMLIQYAN